MSTREQSRQRRLKEEESKSNLMFWNVAWLLINGVSTNLNDDCSSIQGQALTLTTTFPGDPNLLRSHCKPESVFNNPNLLPLQRQSSWRHLSKPSHLHFCISENGNCQYTHALQNELFSANITSRLFTSPTLEGSPHMGRTFLWQTFLL